MKVIAVHVERCMGCKTCELYCATERGSEGKTLLRAVGEEILPQARLRVEGGEGACLPVQCRHCADAPCLDACLTGALVRDEARGHVVVRDDKCIGCWTCVMFCPYGVIFPWVERKFALKCDRCTYMEFPVCVDVCPTKALDLVDVDDLGEAYREKRRVAAAAAVAAAQGEGLTVLDLA